MLMEQKNLKTSVFSLDTVFCESAEQGIDIDFTLPDYYADISKILKCKAVSRISSKSISGNRISIEGCVTITVIYCGSDNCISSYECQYPFTKNFDTEIDTNGCMLSARTKCEYINCRAVTSRKIDIHGAAGIYITLTRRKFTDVISDCDDCNVELLRGSVPATVPMGTNDKYLFIEEEIELGAGQPDIRCIIRYDADAVVSENKIMAGKLVVKGEMIVKLLYAPQGNGLPQTVRYQLPFSQLIEIEGITDRCDCESKVDIVQLEIKPRVSASGECRQFMLTAKLLITSECCCNNDVAVILDAYSRKYEAIIDKNDISFSKICDSVNKNFTCKKSLEFADASLATVADMWCESRTDSVKFNDDAMHIHGSVTVYIIALDCDKIPVFYEKTIDFEFTHPIKATGELKCSPQISVTSANYTLTGDGNMEIRVELNVCAAIYKCSSVPLITHINVNNEKPVAKNAKAAMTLYYAAAGEKIWDIARHFYADVDEIKQINEIDGDILTDNKMILISNN